MLQKLFFSTLIVLVVACSKDQVHLPANVQATQEVATTNTNDALSTQRISPAGKLKANASGPAAVRGAGKNTSATSVSSASAFISFTPNAGTIWRDPVTGETHLLALQLPGTPGRHVKWQSLGTGWEGSELMAMDQNNFYIVWQESVFRVPKYQPDVWYLLIPSNGDDIKGIWGYKNGGFMIRGQKLYAFSETGTVASLFTPFDYPGTTRLMAGFRQPNGNVSLFFITGADKLWYYSSDLVIPQWNNPYYYQPGKFFRNMVGNPMTQLVYQSYEVNGRAIHQLDVFGQQQVFSYQNFTAGAPLVVNNGYVWIMGDTLHQLMTLGSQKGKSAYSEAGWGGILLACADPELVLN